MQEASNKQMETILKISREYCSVEHPSMLCTYEQEDTVVFSNARYNGMFSFDKKTYDIKYITNFPDEKIDGENIHRKIIKFNESYYFMPFLGDGISVWLGDIEKIQFFSIKDLLLDKWEGSSESFLHNGKIWIFPKNTKQPLLYFDITSSEYVNCDWWNKTIELLCGGGEINFSIRSFALIENDVWFVALGGDVIYKMNLLTYEIDKFTLCNNVKLVTLHFIDGYLWMTMLESNDILRWDINNHEEVMYKEKKVSRYSDISLLTSIVKYKNEIIGIPRFGKNPFFINKSGEWTMVELPKLSGKRVQGFYAIGYNPLFMECCVYDDKLIILPYSLDGCYIYDGLQWKYKELKIDIKGFDINPILKRMVSRNYLNNLFEENEMFGLKDLVYLMSE